MNTPGICDIDQHLDDLNICDWSTVLPARYAARGPRNVEADGVERLWIDDRLFQKPAGPGCGSPLGSKAGGGKVTVAQRLEWMDSQHIGRAIFTPGNLGMALHAVPDMGLRQAIAAKYQDWQLSQAALSAGRCGIGVLTDPFALPSQEILENPQTVCLYMRPTNEQGLHFWDEPMQAVLKLASETGLPIMLHGGTGYYQTSPMANYYSNYFYTHLFSHPTEMQIAMAELIGHGLFQAYPGLKVVFVEAGVSWVPSFVSRLQNHINHLGRLVPGKDQDVQQVFHDHCLFSVFNEDADGLGALLAANPWMKTAIGTDYPHWDAMDIRNVLRDVPAEQQAGIASGHALDFFRW